jgi:hypothetical protein
MHANREVDPEPSVADTIADNYMSAEGISGALLGINISATKYVTLDLTHEKRVDTSLDRNPTAEMVGDLLVHYVFRRNHTGDLDRDGNPLAYALKGMNGYNIVPLYRKQIMDRARKVLEAFITGIETDYIMPLPSTYPFANEFCDLGV